MIHKEQHYTTSELLRMEQTFKIIIALHKYHLQKAIIEDFHMSILLAYQRKIIEAEEWLAICRWKQSRE